jgi:hypothetical protein
MILVCVLYPAALLRPRVDFGGSGFYFLQVSAQLVFASQQFSVASVFASSLDEAFDRNFYLLVEQSFSCLLPCVSC